MQKWIPRGIKLIHFLVITATDWVIGRFFLFLIQLAIPFQIGPDWDFSGWWGLFFSLSLEVHLTIFLGRTLGNFLFGQNLAHQMWGFQKKEKGFWKTRLRSFGWTSMSFFSLGLISWRKSLFEDYFSGPHRIRWSLLTVLACCYTVTVALPNYFVPAPEQLEVDDVKLKKRKLSPRDLNISSFKLGRVKAHAPIKDFLIIPDFQIKYTGKRKSFFPRVWVYQKKGRDFMLLSVKGRVNLLKGILNYRDFTPAFAQEFPFLEKELKNKKKTFSPLAMEEIKKIFKSTFAISSSQSSVFNAGEDEFRKWLGRLIAPGADNKIQLIELGNSTFFYLGQTFPQKSREIFFDLRRKQPAFYEVQKNPHSPRQFWGQWIFRSGKWGQIAKIEDLAYPELNEFSAFQMVDFLAENPSDRNLDVWEHLLVRYEDWAELAISDPVVRRFTLGNLTRLKDIITLKKWQVPYIDDYEKIKRQLSLLILAIHKKDSSLIPIWEEEKKK